jgi:hypothetical protein
MSAIRRLSFTVRIQEMGKRITQITVAALSLLVMVQTLYWPLIRNANFSLEWWHNLFLAEIGKYVGFPIWVVLFKSPFDGNLNHTFAWVLIIAWTTFLYLLTGATIGFIQKPRK